VVLAAAPSAYLLPVSEIFDVIGQSLRALVDPTAPVPSFWPTGVPGAFLVFLTQIGAGIPIGVIMARDSGLNPFQTAGLYLASDVLLALICEPLLMLLRWESRRVVWLAELGARLKHMSTTTGLRSGRVRGPLGLVLFSFVIGPAAARALSETVGYRPVSGWSLAILGDMLYFGLAMAATLLVIHIFGDNRLAIAPLALGVWLLPLLLPRLRAYGFRYDSKK
jgi:hypothetical protein